MSILLQKNFNSNSTTYSRAGGAAFVRKKRGLRRSILFLFLFGFLISGCLSGLSMGDEKIASVIFTGGRFRFLQAVFDEVYGVVGTEAGYTGGSSKHPSGDNYSITGHREAVKVVYHTKRVTFKSLIEVYFRNIDPTDSGGQFNEQGSQYAPAVLWTEDSQRLETLEYISSLNKSGYYKTSVVTEIKKADAFYSAKEEDQHYFIMNPELFQIEYAQSGRASYMEMKGEIRMDNNDKIYKKPGIEELKAKLNSLQYHVTQENGTEPPFNNEYWNNHEQGIYVDITSGEPLFSSLDKFDSGTGWPSFTIPLVPGNIISNTDTSYGMVRIEVRSRYGNSHLGHLFNDGPKPTGLRYCINSAALRFIPEKDLEKEGYAEYVKYFK